MISLRFVYMDTQITQNSVNIMVYGLFQEAKALYRWLSSFSGCKVPNIAEG